MNTYVINGRTLEYDDDTHCYICDGIIVPSVTQIISGLYDDYNGVSAEVLKRAKDKGTALHKAIESLETTGEETDSEELQNYKFLKKHYGWINIANEIPVIYEEDGAVIFAGRLDQVIQIGNNFGINDFKRVLAPNKEKICLQLNLYRLGYEQSYHKEIQFIAFTQLRESKRKFVKLPIMEEATKNFIKKGVLR